MKNILNKSSGSPLVKKISPTKGDSFFVLRISSGTSEIDFRRFNPEAVERRGELWLRLKDGQIAILTSAIKAQRKVIDYNSHYTAYLVGQTSEEEFEKAAAQFAYHPDEGIDQDVLASRIECLVELTGIDFTVSDLAGIFECDAGTIRQAVGLIQGQHQRSLAQQQD